MSKRDPDLRARFTLYGVDSMSQEDRDEVADWLLKQADAVKDGNLSDRYRARFFRPINQAKAA